MAAPHITGIIALLLEDEPTLSNNEVRDKLIRLCTALEGFRENDLMLYAQLWVRQAGIFCVTIVDQSLINNNTIYEIRFVCFCVADL